MNIQYSQHTPHFLMEYWAEISYNIVGNIYILLTAQLNPVYKRLVAQKAQSVETQCFTSHQRCLVGVKLCVDVTGTFQFYSSVMLKHNSLFIDNNKIFLGHVLVFHYSFEKCIEINTIMCIRKEKRWFWPYIHHYHHYYFCKSKYARVNGVYINVGPTLSKSTQRTSSPKRYYQWCHMCVGTRGKVEKNMNIFFRNFKSTQMLLPSPSKAAHSFHFLVNKLPFSQVLTFQQHPLFWNHRCLEEYLSVISQIQGPTPQSQEGLWDESHM